MEGLVETDFIEGLDIWYLPTNLHIIFMEHEKESPEEVETDEGGHSEKQTDLDIEIRAGEWQSLRRFKRFQQRSRQGKIIAMHQAVTNRLAQLNKLFYPLVAKHPKQAEKLLMELRKLRLMQDFLLQCLVWEKNGELTKDMVPQEVWKMIE